MIFYCCCHIIIIYDFRWVPAYTRRYALCSPDDSRIVRQFARRQSKKSFKIFRSLSSSDESDVSIWSEKPCKRRVHVHVVVDSAENPREPPYKDGPRSADE